MRFNSLLFFLLFTVSGFTQTSDSLTLEKIYGEVLGSSSCYDNLRVLCKTIGHRLAGSPQADAAISWAENTALANDFDTVYLMPVSVPRWERGFTERASFVLGNDTVALPIRALGGSVGTQGVVQGEIVMARSIEELREMGREKVAGKIVFLNKPMNALLINTGAAYGGAFDIRSQGASEAARLGAVACIIRSLTLADDRYPHTGAMSYAEDVVKIPAAALSSADAYTLSQHCAKEPVRFLLEMNCKSYPRTTQYNVIGELKGSTLPEEYIVVGGHLDSWDIGEGAHDDGAGVVQSIEVLRCLKAIGYQPKRTIRCVLFINEEFGNDGGITYAEQVRLRNEYHFAAIESDGGGFSPRGFNLEGSDGHFERLNSFRSLLEPFGLYQFKRGWSGVDIAPLKNERTALCGLSVDTQRYFDYHHSDNDRFENVNKRELQLGAAAMASLVYLIDQHGTE
jgi:hypothetical protein